ncbi:ferritin-like domain-containing protein [Rudaea cellulosilytica]|uniref:ferritin-like domain-containing protein n=1 Tax=Rudaea cellulosilytica TaxID=540746 RepID=UPI0003604C0A|nr:ferritin-like domain-containing protein [Rudaea cellulosilytica]
MDVFALAEACLSATSVEDKLARSSAAAASIATGDFSTETPVEPQPIAQPGRPSRPRLVPPRKLPQRGLSSVEGRAALVHAVAHIEFNAIDLAWDAIYRFRGMPGEYYLDWAQVAADETRHFQMLSARLAEMGHAYGDFDAHNGLWEMAVKTSGSCLERMALVPRVLEARGLDVTPGMIARLRDVGDLRTIEILDVILAEEVAHVAAGSRWFAWCCAREGVDAQATFAHLVTEYARFVLKPPFNETARRAAGFSEEEMNRLMAQSAA